jgi:hypothetical protein
MIRPYWELTTFTVLPRAAAAVLVAAVVFDVVVAAGGSDAIAVEVDDGLDSRVSPHAPSKAAQAIVTIEVRTTLQVTRSSRRSRG